MKKMMMMTMMMVMIDGNEAATDPSLSSLAGKTF